MNKKSILALETVEQNGFTVGESLTTPLMPIKSSLLTVIGEKYEEQITNLFGDITKLDLTDMTVDKIRKYGFTPTVAKKVFSLIQFSLALNFSSSNSKEAINSPEAAAAHFMHLQYEAQEQFMVVGLNTKNQVVFKEVLFKGTINQSLVHPREIFTKLYSKQGVVSFIVGHQHPSGSLQVSNEDCNFTMRLYEASKVLGLELLDHIIVGDGQFLSMKEKGYF